MNGSNPHPGADRVETAGLHHAARIAGIVEENAPVINDGTRRTRSVRVGVDHDIRPLPRRPAGTPLAFVVQHQPKVFHGTGFLLHLDQLVLIGSPVAAVHQHHVPDSRVASRHPDKFGQAVRPVVCHDRGGSAHQTGFIVKSRSGGNAFQCAVVVGNNQRLINYICSRLQLDGSSQIQQRLYVRSVFRRSGRRSRSLAEGNRSSAVVYAECERLAPPMAFSRAVVRPDGVGADRQIRWKIAFDPVFMRTG